MDPCPKIDKFPGLKGNLSELIHYTEQYRHDMLMQAKHALDRINKLINTCSNLDDFLQSHMVHRVAKRKEKMRKLKLMRKLDKRLRKKLKAAGKKKRKHD